MGNRGRKSKTINISEGKELFEYLKTVHPIHYYKKPPGIPIREIQVPPLKTRNDYNYLLMYWAVDRRRVGDLPITRLQDKREDKLSGYAKDLFDACFKNW